MARNRSTRRVSESLAKAREQAEIARAKADALKAQTEIDAYENMLSPAGGWGGGSSWGDLANPYNYRSDGGGGQWFALGAGSLYSRQYGRNRPFSWTDFDLDAIRSLARWLAIKNDFAAGLIRNLTNFTVKKGFKWEAHPAKGWERDPDAIQLAKRCQRIIDEFGDVNKLASRERSCVVRSIRDGEWFVRFFDQGDGRTLVRFVEPEQIREGGGFPFDPHAAYGIVTDPDDVEMYLAYRVTYDGTNFDEIPAEDICHHKINVDECVKRGLSDFYACGETLENVAKLLRNMTIAGGVQAAIAWIEQFESATSAQVSSYSASVKDLNRPAFTNPITGRDPNYRKYDAGSIPLIGKGKQYIPPPVPVGSNAHIQIVQAALRSVAARRNIPEFMLTSDASNNAYASILVTGSPFVNSIECDQHDLGQSFLRWRWTAIRNACRHGLLGDYSFRDVMHLVDVNYTPPEVAVTNEGEQASIDHQDISAGVMSLQTRRARRGLDDDQEKRNIEAEKPTRVSGQVTDLDPQGNPVEPASEEPPQQPKASNDPMAGLVESATPRREGEVWKGDSGRYFTLKDGHTVPTAAPTASQGQSGSNQQTAAITATPNDGNATPERSKQQKGESLRNFDLRMHPKWSGERPSHPKAKERAEVEDAIADILSGYGDGGVPNFIYTPGENWTAFAYNAKGEPIHLSVDWKQNGVEIEVDGKAYEFRGSKPTREELLYITARHKAFDEYSDADEVKQAKYILRDGAVQLAGRDLESRRAFNVSTDEFSRIEDAANHELLGGLSNDEDIPDHPLHRLRDAVGNASVAETPDALRKAIEDIEARLPDAEATPEAEDKDSVRGIKRIRKAIEATKKRLAKFIRESMSEISETARREGEVWKGNSGRYFTIKDGRTVPTTAHNAGDKTATPVAKIDTTNAGTSQTDELTNKALSHVGGLTSATKAIASKIGEAAWGTLNPDEQKAIAGAYAVGKWLLHHAETGMRKAKQMVEIAAKERGIPEEKAKRIARIVSVIDTAMAWTVNVPAVTIATGNPILGKAAGLTPLASMAYLAYSTARNPLATLKAAKLALKTPATENHESINWESVESVDVTVILDAITDLDESQIDWFEALLSVALDNNDYDIPSAIESVKAAIATSANMPDEESAIGDNPQ